MHITQLSQDEARPSTQIAIIGIGCWYPGAQNPKQLWENILARRRQFRRMPDVRLPLAAYQDQDRNAPDKTYGVKAAVIDGYAFDWAGRRIPKSTYDATDLVHWLALDVALQMLDDANYQATSLPRETTQVVVGNTLTGEFTRANMLRLRWPFVNKMLHVSASSLGMSTEAIDTLARQMEQQFKSVFAPVNEDTLAGGLANTIAGRICNYLNLNGGGYTVDGACSSSLLAVYTAATSLANGTADFAIAGGVDVSLDPFELVGFAKTGALTPSEMSVYDKRGNGFIPGEGCGFVGMKRLADAQRDGDKIYAILDGWGMSSDGKGGITAPSVNGQSLALSRAYRHAGIDPHEIDFIEGHGTGTTVGDRTELLAIANAFKASRHMSPRRCGVTSFKSIVGHTKAAAGIGAFIKAVIAANQRVIPPTAGCEWPHDVFSSEATCLYPVLRGSVWPEDQTLRAGVSAMGFGGINVHVTLKSGGHPLPELRPDIGERAAMASRQHSELFCFSASSLSKLADLIQHVQAEVDGASVAEMTDLAAALNPQNDPTHPIKAAVLASTPDELSQKLNILVGHCDTPPLPRQLVMDQDHGLMVSNQTETCSFGYIFPGQGSQRTDMARGLVERFEWARALVDAADGWAAELGTKDLAAYMYPDTDHIVSKEEREASSSQLKPTQRAQPAIVLASLLWLKYLRRLGLTAEVAMGHSLGELTAFYAAGALDDKSLIQLATLRGQLMAGSDQSPCGGMISLSCDKRQAQQLMTNACSQGLLVLANINSPSQTVVSGDLRAIEALYETATQHGVKAYRLPVSNAFHSPMVATAAEQLLELAPMPQQPTTLQGTLISSCDGHVISPEVDLRMHFATQITRPVDFISAVESLHQHCDVAFEVGPGNILSNLIAQGTLGDRLKAFPVERQAESFNDLNWLLALAHVYGKSIRWQEVYAGRLVRPFVPARQLVFIENPCERQIESIAVPEGSDGLLAAGMHSSEPLERQQATQEAVSVSGLAPHAASSKRPAIAPEAQIVAIASEFTGFDTSTISLSSHLVDDLNLDSIKAVELAGRIVSALNLQEAIDPAHYATATLSDFLLLVEPAGAATSPPAPSHVTAQAVLIDLAAQSTGFDRDTIQPTFSFVDDLNLDSIKIAALVSQAEAALGLEKHFDPADVAGATIGEVAAKMQTLMSSNHPNDDNSPRTPLRRETTPDAWVRSFEMHLVPSPLDTQNDVYPIYKNRVVAIQCEPGEQAFAATLRDRLEGLGATVIISTGRQLQQMARNDIAHFVVILPRQVDSQGHNEVMLKEAISRLRAAVVVAPQQTNCMSLSYVQFGGISTGTALVQGHFATASTASFAASLHLERPQLHVRVIDLHADVAPTIVADRLIAEQSGYDRYVLSHYDENGQRYVLIPQLIEPQFRPSREMRWSGKDVVVATGGAKGITAACALAFAKATGVRMVLVGSSPYCAEEVTGEIGQTLSRYAEAGLYAQYRQCDLVDADAVQILVKDIAETWGPISAVIHGAGINRPRRVEQATEEDAFMEVAPKLQGMLNLCRALEATPPRLIVALSSIIGITGMPGNAWYAFSNEALNLSLQNFRRNHATTQIVSLAYSVWGEIGMGAKMGSTKHLAKLGVSAIPPEAGVAHFMHAVMKETATPQVIIASRLTGLDTWRHQACPTPEANRFLQNSHAYEPGVELVVRPRLTLDDDLYLRDHYYRGVYLFPTVFGLEAMAQAVAKVVGLTQFTSLTVVDISLTRPIVVGSGSGTEIQLRAEVMERQTAAEPFSVRVGIATEQTGFKYDHFSATFVLESPFSEAGIASDMLVPDAPVQIDPKTELYGGLLFQGPLFQRLQHVWQMDTSGSMISIERRAEAHSFSSRYSEALILGDPYGRDVLLQSAQLSVKGTLLPIHIDALYLYDLNASKPATLLAQTRMTSRTDDGPVCNVTAVRSDNHRMIECLVGYRLKQMEHDETGAEPEDWANPDTRDKRTLREALQAACETLRVEAPLHSLTFFPHLAQMDKSSRRVSEAPLLSDLLSNVCTATGQRLPHGLELQWLEDGKPIVHGANQVQIGVSLAHDQQHCLCIAGQGVQGCDLEPIDTRSEAVWLQLLNPKREDLLRDLMASGDTLDEAGTRLWCVIESVKKALGGGDIALEVRRREGHCVLFSCKTERETLNVLTLSISFTRPPRKMVAMTVQSELKPMRPTAPRPMLAHGRSLLDDDIYNAVKQGPEGQLELCYRFRVTFKDITSRHGINFNIFADWMGRIRELATAGVAREMVADFKSGRWGMVTNHSDIHVVGNASCLDVIEGRMRVSRVYGKFDSSVDMHFEWIKINEDGSEVTVALSNMATTWVEIMGHGVVEVRPFPTYMKALVDTYLPAGCP